VEFDPQRKTNCSGKENCHVTRKSEATATTCKEMPVIPANKVMAEKRTIGKRGAEEEDKALGVADPVKCKYHF
jgi:hypothetical protein